MCKRKIQMKQRIISLAQPISKNETFELLVKYHNKFLHLDTGFIRVSWIYSPVVSNRSRAYAIRETDTRPDNRLRTHCYSETLVKQRSTALATATGGLGLRLLLLYLVIRLKLGKSFFLHVTQYGQRIFHRVVDYVLDLQLVFVIRVRVR